MKAIKVRTVISRLPVEKAWRRGRWRWLVPGLLGILLFVGAPQIRRWLEPPLKNEADVKVFLDGYADRSVPGLQYVAVGPDGLIFEYAGGWADIGQKRAMKGGTTMMAFSMTKTVTALAVLQLVEQERLGLDEELDLYLPDTPYRGQGITVRHLLTHTAGIPNPIPLRWVHLVEEDASFDEDAALAEVLRVNSELRSAPGEQYAYSNIGYWLLGKIVEQVTGQSYAEYVQTNVLKPLGMSASVMDFVIPDPTNHAGGYVAQFSLTNVIKGLVTDSELWGEYEGNWLRLHDYHLNGPAFGGLIGTAHGFSLLLQDQLGPQSALLRHETRVLLEMQQATNDGETIPMTLGWHIGEIGGVRYLYKEGGGGGFHSEMRLYPEQRIGTVVMVNRTEFNSTDFLNRVDAAFLD